MSTAVTAKTPHNQPHANGKHKPTKQERIDDALRAALSMHTDSEERWNALKERGAADAQIWHALHQEFGTGGSAQDDNASHYAYMGDENGIEPPLFWFGVSTHRNHERPTLKGAALVRRVRELLQIPQLQEAAATDDSEQGFTSPHARALTEWLVDVRTLGALDRFIEHEHLQDDAQGKDFNESDRQRVVAALAAKRAELEAAGGALPPNTNPAWDEPGLILVELPDGLEVLAVKSQGNGSADFEFYGAISPTGYHSVHALDKEIAQYETPRLYVEHQASVLHKDYLKTFAKEEKLRKKGEEVRDPAKPLAENTLRAYFDEQVALLRDPDQRQRACITLIEDIATLKPEWAQDIADVLPQPPAPAASPDPAEPRVFKKLIEVELNDHDISVKAKEAARLRRQIAELESELSETSKTYKKQIGGHEEELSRLLGAIGAGRDTLELDVFDRFDYDAKNVETVRADTGAVVDSRKMSSRELQMSLVSL